MTEYRDMVAESDNLRAFITPDDNRDDSPRDWENLGTMACDHGRYVLGDKTDLAREVTAAMHEHTGEVVARWLRIYHGATVVLPLALYDHGGISMSVGYGGGWDSGLVGLIFDTPERREAWGPHETSVEDILRGEVATYDQHLTGDVWGYVVERRETWTNATGDTMHTWEQVDSCWGFYGSDDAKGEAQGAYDAELSA